MSGKAKLGNHVAVGAFALILVAGGADAVMINFDTAPNGSPIPNGTDVATTYASVGVTFARDGGTACGPSVYASNDQPPGFGSPPNVVTTCLPPTSSDINGPFLGRIRADFSQTAASVCVDVLPDSPARYAVLSVYDASDNLIAQTASAPGVTGTICVAGSGIRRARFPGTGSTSEEFARFDNLNVTFAAAPPAGPSLPIPTLGEYALGALMLALAGLAALRLRRS